MRWACAEYDAMGAAGTFLQKEGTTASCAGLCHRNFIPAVEPASRLNALCAKISCLPFPRLLVGTRDLFPKTTEQ